MLSWVTHHTDTDTQVLPADASIEIDSDHGDVRVAVQARAIGGDQHVDVDDDPDSPRRLVASTTSGDVHVEPDG